MHYAEGHFKYLYVKGSTFYLGDVDFTESGGIATIGNSYGNGVRIFANATKVFDATYTSQTLGVAADDRIEVNQSSNYIRAYSDAYTFYDLSENSVCLSMSQTNVNLRAQGTTEALITSDGLTLKTGASVNEFSIDGTLGGNSDDAVPTEKAVKTYVDTVSGSLQTDIIWEIVDTPTTQIRPKVEHLSKAIYTEGNVTIGGDLTVTGTLFYADVETVQVQDNIMHINYGESGAGVTAGEAGMQVDRGSETDYFFIFDEGTDTFRVGVSGTQNDFNTAELQPVATREDVPIDHRVGWWDAPNYTFRTHGDTYITVNSGTDTIVLAASDTTEMTVNTDGMSLKSGASVNEIVTSMSSAATDDQLATAQAIYEYVNTVSGAMVHNELEGLQGGGGGNYYHLDETDYTVLSAITSTDVSQWDTAYSHSQITTGNPHSIDYADVGAIEDAADTVKDTHIDWGSGAGQVDLDDVPDGTSYERVAASQLESGIYIDATTAVKGIASFDDGDFTVTSGAVSIKTDGVDEDQINIANAPEDGYYLKYTAASGMVWTDVSVEGVLESDYAMENESGNCDGGTTDFTIDNAPVDNSLQVYLNGLLQEKGVDYTHNSGTTTVSFAVAPLLNDILIIHYVKASS
jgi:hypothetical protein